MSEKRIILTGGGTAGHVTPNLALLPGLRAAGYKIFYVGGKTGMERELAEKAGLPYFSISTGKLRRYLSLKNITDVGRVINGYGDARKIIKEIKPDIIFSKGGFVGVPVTIAGKRSGVPVVLHESDMTPGLANRISFPFASAVCVSFPETLEKVPKKKGVMTGAPIRGELFSGSRDGGLSYCGFTGNKPVLLVTGGSSGARRINGSVRFALPQLLELYDIVHLCGKGNLSGIMQQGYKEIEYESERLPDLFACADVIASRAGANSICEFLALRKPCLLIPLPKAATSRGDQIRNAESFGRRGFSEVLQDGDMNPEVLAARLTSLYVNRDKYIQAMRENPAGDGAAEVLKIIMSRVK